MLPFDISILIDNGHVERTNKTIKQLFYNSYGFLISIELVSVLSIFLFIVTHIKKAVIF